MTEEPKREGTGVARGARWGVSGCVGCLVFAGLGVVVLLLLAYGCASA